MNKNDKRIRLEEWICMKAIICPGTPFLLQFVPFSPNLIFLNIFLNHKYISGKKEHFWTDFNHFFCPGFQAGVMQIFNLSIIIV